MTARFDDATVDAFVRGWFALFDRRAPVDAYLARLVDDGLQMFYPPDGRIHGKDDFAAWLASAYDAFPKTQHTPKTIEITETTDDTAQLRVVVNWQADSRAADGAPSDHMNLDATQSWTLCRTPDGDGLLVSACIVEAMDPR